ncbi:RPM1-interacting protein 4-like [Benincasa hispida]|uniref:RPM1-interacting protein 4-like n=1 Tax=Benincasa hispida TaxID=102211 RepID=UPI0018FF3492|nr:RPM1-interacting protein 4-like [Benincasa hispida]
MADNEATVPKFGEWDDRDAKAPENYTAIFKKVREGRQEPGIRALTPPRSINNSTNNQNHEHNQKKCCCFPWPRK